MNVAQPLRQLFPGASTRELLVSAGPGWSCFNPSIGFSPEEGYRIIVRSSNYRLDQYGQYNVSDPEGVIRTRNFLGVLDSNLDLVDLQLLKPPDWGPVLFPLVRGLEDARLYWQRDHWQVYGTLRSHQVSGVPTMATARIEHDQMVDPQMLLGPDPNRCEKNWCKFGYADRYVYTCNPPYVIQNGELSLQTRSHAGPLRPESGEFRGGGPLVYVDNPSCENIGITHEVDWNTGHRRYWHRFCVFDAGGMLTAFTPPFFFVFDELLDDVPMIEYAAGMVSYGDDYVVSLGFQDSRAFLATIPKTSVHKSMQSAFA